MTELNPTAWLEKAPQLRGWLIFSKVWGSHSHNTNIPTSDVDYLGVYVAFNRDLLGLQPPADTIDNPEGVKPDYQIHEIGKFCNLLLKGNPGIIEMLFSDRLTWSDPKWAPLKAERKRFLTQRAVAQYLGYMQGQLKKFAAHGGKGGLHTKGGEWSEKWAYHMVRLGYDARRIAQGQEPLVWKEGAERDTLMEIRTGQWSQKRVEDTTLGLIHEIDGMKPWAIPEEGDREWLNEWLLGVRGLRG